MTHPTAPGVPAGIPTGPPAGKHQVTIYGQRHWERLVALTIKKPGDDFNARLMADALAALVAELTPLHRTNLAAEYLRGATGRMHTHPLPPGLPVGDVAAQEKWAALVLLDCVDHVSDRLSADHDIYERQAWRRAAEAYTHGCENYVPTTTTPDR